MSIEEKLDKLMAKDPKDLTSIQMIILYWGLRDNNEKKELYGDKYNDLVHAIRQQKLIDSLKDEGDGEHPVISDIETAHY